MKKGYILLEVLLSLVILATVLLISTRAISAYTRSATRSGNITLAAILGQQILAHIHQDEFKIGTYTGSFKNQAFSWKVNVDSIDEKVKKFSYSVLWQESGRQKSLDMETIKYSNQ